MAYREGEELRSQVARSKGIPVKSVVINLAADCTVAGLIAARHPSASSGPPHLTSSTDLTGCLFFPLLLYMLVTCCSTECCT